MSSFLCCIICLQNSLYDRILPLWLIVIFTILRAGSKMYNFSGFSKVTKKTHDKVDISFFIISK